MSCKRGWLRASPSPQTPARLAQAEKEFLGHSAVQHVPDRARGKENGAHAVRPGRQCPNASACVLRKRAGQFWFRTHLVLKNFVLRTVTGPLVKSTSFKVSARASLSRIPVPYRSISTEVSARCDKSMSAMALWVCPGSQLPPGAA
jgi:hypothetical protein